MRKIIKIRNYLLIVLLISVLAYGFRCSKLSKNPIYISPATQDFSKNPKLLERILSGPHGYFRFINIKFSNEVCHRFSNIITSSPSVNLHGDAHLEQYAVTDLGRGLTDFDDSATGPAFIDWLRFGVSLHLACYELGWSKKAPTLFDTFLKGYIDALNDPQINSPEPDIVKQIQSKFKHDRVSYFEWIDSVMEPMPESEKDSVMIAMQPYIETQYAEKPDLAKEYFKIVEMGYLHMGIGSALDLKYLVRIYGETSDPYDDIVLEVKQVRDISGIECISTAQKNDPFRILLGQARIAYQPFHHLGYFSFRGLNFWVHSWVDNYKEVSIDKSFKSIEDLSQVVYDIGVQLGLGHVKHIAAPLDLQVRRTLLRIINDHQKEMQKMCNEFVEMTIAAWKQFSDEVNQK